MPRNNNHWDHYEGLDFEDPPGITWQQRLKVGAFSGLTGYIGGGFIIIFSSIIQVMFVEH